MSAEHLASVEAYTGGLIDLVMERTAITGATTLELGALALAQVRAVQTELAGLTDGSRSPHIGDALKAYRDAAAFLEDAMSAVMLARRAVTDRYVPEVMGVSLAESAPGPTTITQGEWEQQKLEAEHTNNGDDDPEPGATT